MNFKVNLNNLSLGGFAPGYWKSTYPTYGSNNQAADIVSCDLTNPEYLQQGVGLATVTGTVSALMKRISNTVIGLNSTSWGIGGSAIYKVEPTAVTSIHTINASTGFKYPAAVAEPAAPFNGAQWTNPTYAYLSDGIFATSTAASQRWNVWKTFGLDTMPDGATITGMEVLIEAKGNTEFVAAGLLATVYITKDGTNYIAATYKATPALTGTNTVYVLGGSNDLWGTTLAKADLGATFGIIVGQNGTATGGVMSLDSVRINIYYTPTAEDGEDLITLDSAGLLYSHGTKIGQTDFTTYHDEVYSSLVSGAPHQFEVIPGSTIGFVSNGYKLVRFIYPGSTLTDYSTVLTFTDNTSLTRMEIQSIKWHDYRLWIASNFPKFTGRKKSVLYSYNGSGSTYEKAIAVDGELGALFEMNGILYVFYKKNYEDGVCTLAYCDGYKVVDVKEYTGSLPAYYQVSTYKDFLIWMSGTDIFAFGGGVTGAPNRIFKLGVGSTGGIANPFGTPVVAFADALKKFSGYTVTSSWKSISYDINYNSKTAIITGLGINFEKLSTGARVDITIRDNNGNALVTDTISYTTHPSSTYYYRPLNTLTNNFKVELDYANGSTTNSVQIKNITIYGSETLK